MPARRPRLGPTGPAALSAYLAQVRGGNHPATFLGLTSAEEELYFGASGQRVYGKDGEVNEDTLLQLWSSTKLVTTVVALQQVDQGRIGLDDADRLHAICPELASLQVLEGYADDGKPIFRRATKRITLRMLLNHTCGIPYSISSPTILRYVKENNIPEVESSRPTIASFVLPLLHEPGTRWLYGMGIDWAGIMVERLSGMDLEAYFNTHVWPICGVTSISFLPPSHTQWVERRGMAMTTRQPFHDGIVRAKRGEKTGDRSMSQEFGPMYSGGAGLFGTARDYLAFLRAVLRSGSPDTANRPRLISAQSYKLLFTDTLPDIPQIRRDLKQFVISKSIYDQPAPLAEHEVGHALGSFIVKKDLPFGRKAFSATWEGMTKTYHWIDPASGIAGICFTNLFSPPPDIYRKVFNDFEILVYKHLENQDDPRSSGAKL